MKKYLMILVFFAVWAVVVRLSSWAIDYFDPTKNSRKDKYDTR